MYTGIAIGVVVGVSIAYLLVRSSRIAFASESASKFGAVGRAKIAEKIEDRKGKILVFVLQKMQRLQDLVGVNRAITVFK